MLPRANDPVLRRALSEFEWLLSESTLERDFQNLFAEHPFILSRSLPMRVEEQQIKSMARSGKSDPDFVIFPRSDAWAEYGVIELKRPSSRILVEPRKGIVTLSADARTAVAQAEVYAAQLGREVVRDDNYIFLGNRRVLFVIMGLSSQIADQLGQELLTDQLDGLLPSNCKLIPYDTLHRAFESSLPPRIVTVFPDTTVLFGQGADRLAYETGDAIASNAVWRWEYHEVTDGSLDFWRRIATAASGRDSRVNPEWFDRHQFETSDGRLDMESAAVQTHMTHVHALASVLVDHSRGDSSERFRSFLRGWAEATTARTAANLRQRELLRDAIARVRGGDPTAFLQLGDPDVEQITRLGLVRLCTLDSGESYYNVHPVLRWVSLN